MEYNVLNDSECVDDKSEEKNAREEREFRHSEEVCDEGRAKEKDNVDAGGDGDVECQHGGVVRIGVVGASNHRGGKSAFDEEVGENSE